MEVFVGTICIFPYQFEWAPEGWLPCDGRLMPIEQNRVLYALIGPYYGGDGKTTFALPNLPPIQLSADCKMIYCIATEGMFPPSF